MLSREITILKDKHLILGVTGSIAAYKAADLASKLTQTGALVDVVMTQAAQRFVSPLTFEGVTGRPAYTDMWSSGSEDLPTHIAHVGLGEGADLLLIAPATANTIARLAAGLADDLLSVTALAVRCPVVIAPAMDGAMYSHPATQANLETLRQRGVTVIEPEVGRFASGLEGKGRLPDTPTLIGQVRRVLGQHNILEGRHLVITAGGTREPLDPVRFITNHSSGKQGYALAQAALDAGATVTLISTTSTLPVPIGLTHVQVGSAQEMLEAVQNRLPEADALIMAAAVADYRPAEIAEQKIKKAPEPGQGMQIELARNPDILREVHAYRKEHGRPRVVVGFAAESQDLLANAQAKLEAKGLDMIVANDITATDSGFGADNNRVIVLDAKGAQREIDLTTKARVAEYLVQRVATLLNHR